MSKKIPISTAIIAVLITILLTFQITYTGLNNHYKSELNSLSLENGEYSKLNDVISYYEDKYIGKLDEDSLEELLIQSFVSSTGDKYGYYYNKEAYDKLVDDQNGEAVGIGITAENHAEEGYIGIIWVSKGSSAEAVGLLANDRITAVGGESVQTLGYSGTVEKIRGEVGTTVDLTVLRGTDTLNFTVSRAKFTMQSVLYHLCEDGKTGIIKILSFDATTCDQFKAAVEDLVSKGATQFVYDVRNNPGGLLTSVCNVLDYILPEGAIVTVVNREGKEDTTNSDANCLNYPMAVLTNGSTASAAELFTAALRDYKKAVIVGEKTYGKGVAQTTYTLGDGSAIKLTTDYYNPPCGINYDGVGVKPDVESVLPEELKGVNLYTIPDSTDTQLQAALSELSK